VEAFEASAKIYAKLIPAITKLAAGIEPIQ